MWNFMVSDFWSPIINFLILHYLQDSTICIIWNDRIDFHLLNNLTGVAIVNMKNRELQMSFQDNVVDFEAKRNELLENDVPFNDFIEKLTVSIEVNHCQSFLIFEDDVPTFTSAFFPASEYSIWREKANKFIFVYEASSEKESDYFSHEFFQDQSQVLLVEGHFMDQKPYFNLKTNKYVGPRNETPEEMYSLDIYDIESQTFLYNRNLFPDKTKDLFGREMIVSVVDYKPSVVLTYSNTTGEFLSLDGTEARIIVEFCVLYNCTIKVDDSQSEDWGMIYPNMSGTGALSLIVKRKADVTVGAMYIWRMAYIYSDLSHFIGRNGITLVVPAPRHLASWLLPVEPFTPALWGGVFALLCIETLGLLMAHKYEKWAINESISWFQSLKFAFTITMKLFLSQPGRTSIVSFTVRVLLFACFLNDLIITSIYGGGLASILTIPSLEEAADSVERLRTHQLKWRANSEAWVLNLRASEEPHTKEILQNFAIYPDEVLAELVKGLDMGFCVERMHFGHFAIGDFLTEDVLKHYKIMVDDINFEYTVAFVPRCWPLLEQLDTMVLMWHSHGFDKFWEWRIVANTLNNKIQKMVEASQYTNYEEMGPVKLGLSNFVGILLIWVVGTLLAVCSFITEILVTKFQEKKQKEALDEELMGEVINDFQLFKKGMNWERNIGNEIDYR